MAAVIDRLRAIVDHIYVIIVTSCTLCNLHLLKVLCASTIVPISITTVRRINDSVMSSARASASPDAGCTTIHGR